jgi:hypothetical protein
VLVAKAAPKSSRKLLQKLKLKEKVAKAKKIHKNNIKLIRHGSQEVSVVLRMVENQNQNV